MAKTVRPRYYFDACVFLSVIEGVTDRIPPIAALLEDCDNAGCEIFTSELSIAEVAFAQAERSGRALDRAIEQRIDGMWEPPIQLVEVHQLIALDAKSLMRSAMEAGWSHNEEWSLKANDAIHLATAKRLRSNAFLTYDRKLRKFATSLKMEIREPETPQGLLFATKEPPWTPRVPAHWRGLPLRRVTRLPKMMFGRMRHKKRNLPAESELEITK